MRSPPFQPFELSSDAVLLVFLGSSDIIVDDFSDALTKLTFDLLSNCVDFGTNVFLVTPEFLYIGGSEPHPDNRRRQARPQAYR